MIGLACDPSRRKLAQSVSGHCDTRGLRSDLRLTGKSPISCPAPFAKIFLFAADPNHRLIHRRPVSPEGRLAIVTDAGRDAVDA
jgi:hypothetical protein